MEDLCQDLLGRLQLHGPACHRPGQEWAARDGGPQIKACGPRMDVVFYLLDAMQLFRGMSLEEVREIAFEIGILGRYELDINKTQGDPCPAVAAREDPLRSGTAVHHVRRLQEDRAGDRYRGGPGQGVGDVGEVGKRRVRR